MGVLLECAHVLVFVFTVMQVCLHEPDRRTSFPHEGIVENVMQYFCSQQTFLFYIQILFSISSPLNSGLFCYEVIDI